MFYNKMLFFFWIEASNWCLRFRYFASSVTSVDVVIWDIIQNQTKTIVKLRNATQTLTTDPDWYNFQQNINNGHDFKVFMFSRTRKKELNHIDTLSIILQTVAELLVFKWCSNKNMLHVNFKPGHIYINVITFTCICLKYCHAAKTQNNQLICFEYQAIINLNCSCCLDFKISIRRRSLQSMTSHWCLEIVVSIS